MPSLETSFAQFPKLPVELRLMIWRECLPHRMVEMDYPLPDNVFDKNTPPPCQLERTTTLNGLPPVITRVCRESRAVALETATPPSSPLDIPDEAEWGSSTATCPWLDFTRDSEHLNWTPVYEAEWGCTGNALQSLAWSVTHCSRGGSLMLESFAYPSYWGLSVSERVDILGQLSSWLVVTDMVVVHTDMKTGAKTGLFGLLGDAPIQIVEVSDEAKLNIYYDLVEACDFKGQVAIPQRRKSPDSQREYAKAAITHFFGTEKVLPPMKPAIMFRLCPEACNHRGEDAEEYRRQRAQARVRTQQRVLGRV